MGKRRSGSQFENDWTEEEIIDFHGRYSQSITIPVYKEIEFSHSVYNFNQVEKYFREASKIVLQDCPCRVKYGHCDSPIHTCLLLNDSAENRIKNPRRNSEQVSYEKAMTTLVQARDAGLVLMAYHLPTEDTPASICNCCSCCCASISGVLKFGLQKFTITKQAVSTHDAVKCTDCGLCVDICHFDARRMKNDNLVYDDLKCFGCGNCVPICPDEAIALQTV